MSQLGVISPANILHLFQPTSSQSHQFSFQQFYFSFSTPKKRKTITPSFSIFKLAHTNHKECIFSCLSQRIPQLQHPIPQGVSFLPSNRNKNWSSFFCLISPSKLLATNPPVPPQWYPSSTVSCFFCCHPVFNLETNWWSSSLFTH